MLQAASQDVFYSHKTTMMLFCEQGGIQFNKPNVPLNWGFRILRDSIKAIGIQYFNPTNSQEFANVMLPRPEYDDPIHHDLYVVYHRPSSLISKDFEANIMFDPKDNNHMQILHQLNTDFPSPDQKVKKAKNAGSLLKDFWFCHTHLQFIRHFLGFNPIPQSIIDHIIKVTCSCHRWGLSGSQGGMLYRHKEHHYFSTRIANHIENPKPFVKIGTTRGYHTETGRLSTANAHDTHISIEIVLGNPLCWNLTPCRKIYSLKKFDYNSAKEFMENRVVEEEQKRGLRPRV